MVRLVQAVMQNRSHASTGFKREGASGDKSVAICMTLRLQKVVEDATIVLGMGIVNQRVLGRRPEGLKVP